jgi:hypothetical protein
MLAGGMRECDGIGGGRGNVEADVEAGLAGGRLARRLALGLEQEIPDTFFAPRGNPSAHSVQAITLTAARHCYRQAAGALL